MCIRDRCHDDDAALRASRNVGDTTYKLGVGLSNADPFVEWPHARNRVDYKDPETMLYDRCLKLLQSSGIKLWPFGIDPDLSLIHI